MKTRSVLVTVLSIGLLAGTALGVTAQDEEPGVQPGAYSRGVAGDVPDTVDPSQTQTDDGQIQIRGLELLDIPVRFADPRISGRLTIASNGTGRNFSDGHARIEPRTYRIDNAEGSWTGEGERVLAVSLRQPRPLLNHESMVLFGDGAYEGFVAYVFIELANPAPELEAVVLDIDMAPLPEPVARPNRFNVRGPRRPAADPVAGASSESGRSPIVRREDGS